MNNSLTREELLTLFANKPKKLYKPRSNWGEFVADFKQNKHVVIPFEKLSPTVLKELENKETILKHLYSAKQVFRKIAGLSISPKHLINHDKRFVVLIDQTYFEELEKE